MGTLFNQEPRRSFEFSIHHAIQWALNLSEEFNISVSEVIKIKKAFEAERANDLYHANGDYFDEQIAGIGEIMADNNADQLIANKEILEENKKLKKALSDLVKHDIASDSRYKHNNCLELKKSIIILNGIN